MVNDLNPVEERGSEGETMTRYLKLWFAPEAGKRAKTMLLEVLKETPTSLHRSQGKPIRRRRFLHGRQWHNGGANPDD